jgi:hypothetical protein
MNNDLYFHNSIFNLYLITSQIPNSGLGVFTKDFIPAGTYIDEYIGDVYSYNPCGSYVVELEQDHYIDAKKYPRCFMGMINDCEYISKKIIKKKKKRIDITPNYYYDNNNNKLVTNCQFINNLNEKKSLIYSVIDIISNSELFINYGPEYWS